MRSVPEIDILNPGPRTRLGYLLWLARRQKVTLALAILWDTVWLLGLALLPWAVGHALDDGILAGDMAVLGGWVLFILALSVIRAVAEPMRNRTGVSNYNQAAFRTAQLVNHQVARAGYALTSRRPVGEVIAVQGDALEIGHIYYRVGGLVSATISYGVVAVILLRTSVPLGLFVLLGVPAFAALLSTLRKPLQTRHALHRTASGEMSALGADAVAGLRVLRGVGGEDQFVKRYQAASDQTRRAGTALSTPIAALQGLEVVVGGALVVALTWTGALLVVNGDMRPGQLVTFFGYASFLVMPIRLVSEAINQLIPTLISSERVLGLLAIRPAAADSQTEHTVGDGRAPLGSATLADGITGIEIVPGTAVGIVAADPTETVTLLERLARLDDAAFGAGTVTWGAVPTTVVPLADVRSRIVLVEAVPHLYGSDLRTELRPHGDRDDAEIHAALYATAADDILAGLPDGLDTVTAAGGRAFSGGQRQRLGLARAILAKPEVLLLVEPTSAVDAHTEQRIADRLLAARARTNQTTVVATTSPLLLRALDVVHLIADGAVVATGAHQQLMADNRYRAVVLRAGA